MDQALHGHHQQPELQRQTALSHMPESTAAQRVLGHSGGGAGAQSPGEGPDSSWEGTAPTPTLRPSCEGIGEKWAGEADPREACHWPLASCPPCTQLCVPERWVASPQGRTPACSRAQHTAPRESGTAMPHGWPVHGRWAGRPSTQLVLQALWPRAISQIAQGHMQHPPRYAPLCSPR